LRNHFSQVEEERALEHDFDISEEFVGLLLETPMQVIKEPEMEVPEYVCGQLTDQTIQLHVRLAEWGGQNGTTQVDLDVVAFALSTRIFGIDTNRLSASFTETGGKGNGEESSRSRAITQPGR